MTIKVSNSVQSQQKKLGIPGAHGRKTGSGDIIEGRVNVGIAHLSKPVRIGTRNYVLLAAEHELLTRSRYKSFRALFLVNMRMSPTCCQAVLKNNGKYAKSVQTQPKEGKENALTFVKDGKRPPAPAPFRKPQRS